jgi:hypothetical protein
MSRIVELVMSQSHKHRTWKAIAAAVVLLTLLLVLLPHPHHLTGAIACPVLAVVFLFGTIDIPFSLWLLSQVSEEHPPQSPDLPSRFQRPPPALI